MTERVIIDRVDTTQTAHAGTRRHLVSARQVEGFAVQYLTVDDGLAAKCLAAKQTGEPVDVRWRPSAWGQKLIAVDFQPAPLAVEVARIRAMERAALDFAIARTAQAAAPICGGCFQRWDTGHHTGLTQGNAPARAPVWIPEAGEYWHLRCWQERQEGITVEEL